MKGLYVLVDGGYHRWRFLQCPLPNSDTWGKRMSGRLESTRKDAECTFGIMKRRFKTLKRPSEYLEMQDVGNEFKVCAILHNMLLQTLRRSLESGPQEVALDCAQERAHA